MASAAELVREAVKASLLNEKKLRSHFNESKLPALDSENVPVKPNPIAHPTKKRKAKAPVDQNWKKLQTGLQKTLIKKKRPFKRARYKAQPAKPEESSDVKYSSFMKRQVESTDEITRVVAVDCEMVGVGKDGKENALARVSLVNYAGDVLYDKFVKVHEEVVDYRTQWSGIRAPDVSPESTSAVEPFAAQQAVGEIIKGRVLVGHALKNDLKVLRLSHPYRNIRDTSEFFKQLWRKQGRRGGRSPKLQYVVAEVLGVDFFQKSEHDSCEDARAALALYKKFQKEWESGIREKGKRRNKPAKKE